MIPFKKVNLGNAYAEVGPLFASGMIGDGEIVRKFEEELAQYVGAKYVVCTSSCTAALFLACKWEAMRGVKKVSIPSMTFCLAADAALQAGLDIEFNDDVLWVGSWYRYSGSRVIDSAHELKRGCFRSFEGEDKLCFSFYPTKTIGSADGGAIATNDEEFVKWARMALMYGRSSVSSNSWENEIGMVGYKLNWNDLQAAIALEQLHRLDQTHSTLKMINDTYNTAFDLKNDSDYLYTLSVPHRDKFMEYMKDNGVQCGIHFKPLHLMEPFKNFPVENQYDIEKYANHTVSLPLYSTLTVSEVMRIVQLTQEWINVT